MKSMKLKFKFLSGFTSLKILLLAIILNSIDCYAQSTKKGLKDYYKNYFPIGVAVSSHSLQGQEAEFVLAQFNSLTPEDAMKMDPIHPEENHYFWRSADSIVNFAQKHNLWVRGHNLCWHEQTPNWLFKDANGNEVKKKYC